MRRSVRGFGFLFRGQLALLLSLTTGCLVGPDFKPPETWLPEGWYGEKTQVQSEQSDRISKPSKKAPAVTEWWTLLNDPVLDALIKDAVESNLDLKVAEARVRQARASLVIARAPLFPEINSSADFRRSKSQESGGESTVDFGGGSSRIQNSYQAGFDAAWELDFFGGIRREVEAADADLQSAEEARRNVLVTLLSETGRNYVELRGAQRELAVAQENLLIQQKSVDLSRQRFEAGFVSQLDVVNAQSQVATTRSQIPVLEASIEQSIFNISVLVGEPPAALIEQLALLRPIPVVPMDVPVGLPSELLKRRPDIRQAEADFHAANARVGAATADLFPKFSLTGSFGVASDTLDNITHEGHRVWSIAPGVSWPLFDAGRIRANIELNDAQAEAALISYQQTVLTALKEVESALSAYRSEQQRRLSLVEAVEANKKAVALATDLYVQGQTDFLNVISAKGQLFSSESSLAQSDRNIGTDLIALYKALGGGWETGEQSVVAKNP